MCLACELALGRKGIAAYEGAKYAEACMQGAGPGIASRLQGEHRSLQSNTALLILSPAKLASLIIREAFHSRPSACDLAPHATDIENLESQGA